MTGSKYLFVVALLIANMFFAKIATQNAMAAHRHTHELACHVGATELCDYHEGESHD